MIKRIRFIISMIFVVPIVALTSNALVSARQGDSGSEAVSNTTAVVASPDNETETEAVKPDDVELLRRLTDRKTSLKTKLTTAEQSRLKLKCVPSQTGSIKSLSGRIKGIETSRRQTHKNLLDRLDKLVEKLKVKNVDTTELEAEIVVLKTKIATFDADLVLYKQAITDLKSMDCVADPVSFKASLETARTLKQTVATDSESIKSYVNDTIKPTLKIIRTALETAEKLETNTTDGTQ